MYSSQLEKGSVSYGHFEFIILVSGEIESQINEIKDIERSIRAMQNDMTKLNLLIHKNRDMQSNLQQDNILLENDFIATLKVRFFSSLCCVVFQVLLFTPTHI